MLCQVYVKLAAYNANRQVAVTAFLIAELAQRSAQSKLYDASQFVDLSMILFFLLTISLAATTNRRRLANACFDALLVIDSVKLCLSLHRAGSLMQVIYPATLSTMRLCLFSTPTVWKIVSGILKDNPNVTGSILSLWQLPFRIASIEDINDLGEEFNSGSLHLRYNQSWEQCKPTYKVSLAMYLTISSCSGPQTGILFCCLVCNTAYAEMGYSGIFLSPLSSHSYNFSAAPSFTSDSYTHSARQQRNNPTMASFLFLHYSLSIVCCRSLIFVVVF